ncbi:hypothetical protein V6Z11_D02G125200 [Gossypium hirsutum]|uniref:Plant UBX domain-containing protein 13 n=1 Tax=Gossypium hirsutum TaxID=3635 RepID=A0A1U8K0B6_GOSHI|nr:plant UBX domain-containing protein 13 [Gossypium hirsutum]
MLEEHAGNLNTAVTAYFSEGDRPTSTIVPVDDAMDVDDPNEVVPNRPVFPFLPLSRTNEQSSLHDRNFHSSFFDGDSGSTHEPMVTHPTEVR